MMNHINTNFTSTIPNLYEQQGLDEIVAYAKYTVPLSDWRWYIFEYSKLQKLFYGYIEPEQEYRYFTIDELVKTAYDYDIEIFLDSGFKPKTIGEIVK